MGPDRPNNQPPLADGWDAQADAWIAWTRAGLDSFRSHREDFLPLIPGPGRLTVDVGCGEGRVSRELQARGHRVLAIDRSPIMVRGAVDHDHPVPAVVGDATALPLPSGSADCAVAFMCLHDIDDLAGAVREIARVLAPGGTLVAAISHPLSTAGHFPGDRSDPSRPYVIDGSYTRPRRHAVTRSREGRSMTYHGVHRPLQNYTEALTDAGFVITRLLERSSDDPGDKWHRIPVFLHLVARR